MTTVLRALWAEPRPPLPTTTAWGDRVLVAAFMLTATLEACLRDDIQWRPLAVVLALTLPFTLLARRRHAFAAFLTAFGVLLLVELAALVSGSEAPDLHSGVFVLVLVYSLFRFGAGSEAMVGLGVMVVVYLRSVLGCEMETVADAVGSGVVFLFPAVLGVTVRSYANAQRRALDEVKLFEREKLARELHDTVAHHVSAIAIQAQAGRAVAATRTEVAVEVLAVIEEAASRTLTELRVIVGALRDEHDEAARAPLRGVADIARLARSAPDRCPVRVELGGKLDELRPSVDAALYRLAQESITNALRHGTNATEVCVRIDGDDDVVRLTVSDDGEGASSPSSRAAGFGLVGMSERASLLGGTFAAGPRGPRGWAVEATLPKRGAPR